mgnify:CR=1 FL=1
MSGVMIRLAHVAKSYDEGATYAVEDVNLEIEEGELVVLLGESGCGKTTTLKMINRLIDLSDGIIEVEDVNVSEVDAVELRRSIGYVFQQVGLFPHLTVRENIGIGPTLLKWSESDRDQRVAELLDLMNLPSAEFADRDTAHLSGGQRQRIGLARALAVRPKIMLMDEPLGALDPLNRDELQDEFKRIHQDLGLTTVMVKHDITEALLMADRVAVLNRGQIIRIDQPHELVVNPEEDYVKHLMDMPKRLAKRLDEIVGTEQAS